MSRTHVMIDIETLDNVATAVITQIGAVSSCGKEFKMNIDIKDSMKYGTIGADTLKWWFGQSKEAQAHIRGTSCTLAEALEGLNLFIEETNPNFIWSHATFDFPILSYAYRQVGSNPVWAYWALRDLRTIEHFYGDEIEWKKREGVHHDALDDAKYQMDHLIKMLEEAEKNE